MPRKRAKLKSKRGHYGLPEIQFPWVGCIGVVCCGLRGAVGVCECAVVSCCGGVCQSAQEM